VNQGDTQRYSRLENEKIQEEEKNADRQGAQNQRENHPGPIHPEAPFRFLHRRQSKAVILTDMRTSFGGEGFGAPGAAPALAADFPLAVGTSGKIFRIKGQGGVTNLTTLGIID
jgi:hypothetical protein